MSLLSDVLGELKKMFFADLGLTLGALAAVVLVGLGQGWAVLPDSAAGPVLALLVLAVLARAVLKR